MPYLYYRLLFGLAVFGEARAVIVRGIDIIPIVRLRGIG
jgi:hypothetical protein